MLETVTVPEPEVGARFRDRFSEGVEWEVVEHDQPGVIRLRQLRDGEETDASPIDWPRGRWHALFDARAMLALPEDQ